jgi:hypothetical protein
LTHKWLDNAALQIRRQDMSRIVFLYELYKLTLGVKGSIIEFGVRYGADLAMFLSFRGMMAPFQYMQKIVGFDTFSGFPAVSAIDKSKKGEMGVPRFYDKTLEHILTQHEQESPISHIKKFELVKGDACKTCKAYLKANPQTIIALAYFDMDIYKPTKVCLELCKKHFVKGSVIAFDELNHSEWRGETVALQEVLGLNNIRLKTFDWMPTASYFIFE